MITAFYGLSPVQKQLLKKSAPKLKVQIKSGLLSVRNLPSPKTEILSVHSDCQINAGLLAKLPNLKFIITRTVGVDHIDLAACRRAKVAVANCPGLNSTAVAEFTMGLLLVYLRNVPQALQAGKKLQFNDAGFMGGELAGKTLGIVGTGAIGSQIAQIANGFGMTLLGFDARKNRKLEQKFKLRYMGLKQLFQKADVITLHVPATPLTEHLVNRALLSHVKPGVVLINTARGSVVETKALIQAMDNEKVAAYLTDVLQYEAHLRSGQKQLSTKEKQGILEQKRLAKHAQVWVTPHIAHATAEASARVLDYTIQQIARFQKGQKISLII